MGRVRGGRRQSRDAWCSAVGRGYLGGTGRDETGRPSVGPWSADSTASTRGWRAEGTRVLTEGGGSQLRLEARASAPLGSLGANQAITIGTFYAPSFPRACTRGLPEIPCHVCGRPEFGGNHSLGCKMEGSEVQAWSWSEPRGRGRSQAVPRCAGKPWCAVKITDPIWCALLRCVIGRQIIPTSSVPAVAHGSSG